MTNTPFKLPGNEKRKPRGSAVARVLGWLFALAIISAIAVGSLGAWLYARYNAPGPLQQATIVDVPRNLDRMQVAQFLHDKGVVSDSLTMGIAAFAQAVRGSSMRAGEYEFPANASMAEVFNIMASGRVVMYKFTVPEGWTSEMAVKRLMEQEPMAGDVAAIPAEGAVIANTYLYARGKSRQQLLDEMVRAQSELIEEIWARRPADTILKDKNEMVTLASIVEKETGKADERPRVAAVFLNRLKAGMRLQSDPTIIYGLVGGKGKLDRPITQSDIDSDTPFNTYRINGLPPSPIASPGKDAMEAVLNPAPVSDLYFVADGTGGHVFATTLEEHNANVRKWRAIEAGKAQPAPAPEATAAPADPAAQADAPAVPVVQQAALPDVPEDAVAPSAAATPAPPPEAAAAPAPAVPVSADGDAAASTQATAAKPTQEADAQPAEAALKPGTLVKVGDTLVPIPALKKKKP
ncbi:MAG: endolytic transglycosylase MltG [Rhizobiales bacterium]|nr:endolytic transglycosylase MltG [Hyphomicrobiales bacterium]